MTVLMERLGPDRIQIQAGVRMGDLVAQIPGSRHRRESNDWTCPLSWGACLAARGIFGADLTVGPELAAWSIEHAARISTIQQVKDGQILYTDDERLFPEQRTGASFLAASTRCLLADDMRVGKTVQTIAALRILPDAFPALIIAPNSMKHKWAVEFGKWAPEVSTAVVSGTATQRRKAIASGADVVVINWESLRAHSRLAGYGSIHLTDKQREPKELNEIAWQTVIVDEAHRMKDARSQQTRAAWSVMHG